jgi:hypothetical protein
MFSGVFIHYPRLSPIPPMHLELPFLQELRNVWFSMTLVLRQQIGHHHFYRENRTYPYNNLLRQLVDHHILVFQLQCLLQVCPQGSDVPFDLP